MVCRKSCVDKGGWKHLTSSPLPPGSGQIPSKQAGLVSLAEEEAKEGAEAVLARWLLGRAACPGPAVVGICLPG